MLVAAAVHLVTQVRLIIMLVVVAKVAAVMEAVTSQLIEEGKLELQTLAVVAAVLTPSIQLIIQVVMVVVAL